MLKQVAVNNITFNGLHFKACALKITLQFIETGDRTQFLSVKKHNFGPLIYIGYWFHTHAVAETE